MSLWLWLLERGVPADALMSPRSIRFGHVIFDATNGYVATPIGEMATLCDIIDDGVVIDEVAWQPKTGKLATRDSVGWALGQGQFGRDGLGTTGRALPVRRDPLEWFRLRRTGICIVNWPLAALALAGAVLEAADEDQARELRRRLNVPPPVIQCRRRSFAA